jgi:hypothetical protein
MPVNVFTLADLRVLLAPLSLFDVLWCSTRSTHAARCSTP